MEERETKETPALEFTHFQKESDNRVRLEHALYCVKGRGVFLSVGINDDEGHKKKNP